MIASLRGTVVDISLTSAVIETGGVGISVQATPTTLSRLRVGQEALLHTELIVREDSLTLFGFAEADERDVFTILMSAKGVGAKLALAMLAVHTPDALRRAVAQEDVAALKRVPGLGPKGAQRILIDLAGRLGPALGPPTTPSAAPGPQEQGPAQSGPHPDVVAALTQLGWNESSARQAVTAVAADGAVEDTADTAALLRASLRWLGSGRRG
ncbi:Holliday junction branch migration protein RuvA [Actinomyces bowdenii]|uniref:Holliday junction branch migration complex subunit RuvA n=1 Tax=Actinomyces bowdenii TaxID=131109 RepID=A0A853EFA4_9ACTO|nr:Holliday junction branch migration protein RuvA [Actinomyces bowdenii]MBF0695825.1 Holliday junction branch migration protein RuvA [Actinomyces bowdenii]NYS67998.1 Holliday junction branch migration protein RuvA [Actinomyces bowdenii]